MARAWLLKARPRGVPNLSDFELAEVALPELSPGMLRVKNVWLSVDPYMRGRMNDTKSYIRPFALGAPMEGGAVGEVLESRAEGFAPGDKVLHMLGFRDDAVVPAASAQKVSPGGLPEQLWLGLLGTTGATAHFGLLRVAEARPGDVVFVSAAAGAVGSAVVQIAKLEGMTVIASAGGAAKCSWLKELGADRVIDYKARPVLEQLREAAPEGIDVYFDNVGGDHLDAALAVARNGARFALCGMIDMYNDARPTLLHSLPRIVGARLRLRGFIVNDFAADLPKFRSAMSQWIIAGRIQNRETVHDGLESAIDAFLGLFQGANIGKMLVRL